MLTILSFLTDRLECVSWDGPLATGTLGGSEHVHWEEVMVCIEDTELLRGAGSGRRKWEEEGSGEEPR